jgi:Transmembrane secretion effector
VPRRRVTVDWTILRESPQFRLLLGSEVFSAIGSQATLVAVPYQIFVLTRSPVLVGLLGIVELGPLVAGSLLGGVAADRFDRRTVLRRAQVAIALTAGGLTAGALLGDPPVVLVFLLAGALAGAASVESVARTAAVPAVAGPGLLRSALSLNFGLYQVAAIVGPGLGGLLIAAFGVGSAYAVDTAGFVGAFALTHFLRPLPPAPADEGHPPIRESIAEGMRFVRRSRVLMGSFAIDLVAMTFGMPRALFAVLALTVYHAGAAGTGALYASVSAGATIAALTTGWLEHARRLGRIVIAAVLVWGGAIALAGLVPSLAAACALLAIAGAADSISAVCRTTINQTVTPEALRGRMSAVFMLVVTSGPRLGDLESGLAAGALSAGLAVVTGGLACIAGVGAIVLLFPQLAAYDSRAGRATAEAAASAA